MNGWIETVSEPMRMGPSELQMSYLYESVFTPVAMICGVSLLLTVLWTLGVWEYLWLKQRDKGAPNER